MLVIAELPDKPIRTVDDARAHWEDALVSRLARDPVAASARNARGESPLHVALANDPSPSAALVRALLAADPAAARHPERGGMVPLHFAAGLGADVGAVEALLEAWPEGASARDARGSTPLHCAARRAATSGGDDEDDVAVVRCLAWTRPECARARDDGGRTALHHAVAHGASANVVEALLEAWPEGVRARDLRGRTPLHAAGKGAEVPYEVVSALLGANMRTRTTRTSPVVDHTADRENANTRPTKRRSRARSQDGRRGRAEKTPVGRDIGKSRPTDLSASRCPW